MEFGEYQRVARETDQVPDQHGTLDDHLVVPLLGMAGEVGSLLVEYKKLLRDGPAHKLFAEHVSEELGDILWYVANLASKFGVDLDEVAVKNLEKTQSRWAARSQAYELFDNDFGSHEQFPRQFVATLSEKMIEGNELEVTLYVDGRRVGSRLQDNAYEDDGYRFHDVFHLAFVAVLGWSPILRGLLACKRKSVRQVDMIEDGGRAGVIDEGLVAFVFDYARKHNFLQGVTHLDFGLLKTVTSLTCGLEVGQRSAREWEDAILAGFRVWRQVREHRGGRIAVDLQLRTIDYLGPC